MPREDAFKQLIGQVSTPPGGGPGGTPSTPFTEVEIELARRLGISPEQLSQFQEVDEFNRPTGRLDLGRLQEIQRLQAATSPEGQAAGRDPRTIEELIVKAIQSGDTAQAEALDDFRRRPSDADALQTAIDFASSPADVFTLSAFARGVGPAEAPTREEGVRALPRGRAVQQLLDNFLKSSTGDKEIPGFPAAPEPVVQEPASIQEATVPNQPLVTQTHRLGAGPQPFGSINSSLLDPDALTLGLGTSPTAIPRPVPPIEDETPGVFDQVLGGIRTGLNLGSGGLLFPSSPSGIEGVEEIGDIQRFALPPGVVESTGQFQAGQDVGRPGDPFIPEGVPVGTINFNGQERPIPVGLSPIFERREQPRPQSLLGQVGIPIPSAQQQRRLLPSERAAFARLAAEAGIPEAELQQELQSVIPAPQSRRRITSAGV